MSKIAPPALAMEDDLGIVYLIESAQQFWSELEDVLQLPDDEAPTLSLLDATLRRFMALCATYHEQYLQSHLQLEHACNYLIESELFEFHSERMVEIIVEDIKTNTNPHSAFISFEVLLFYGRRRPEFFRSQKRWQPLFPLIMDHVLVEIDPDVEDTYAGTAIGRSSSFSAVPIPIEAKLRSLCVKLLYEVCKVQTLTVSDLKIFTNRFIDYLFDLVEQTKYMHDETFNYSVIKLIIALNEQFMVAALGDDHPNGTTQKKDTPEQNNRVLRVMMRRLGSCGTFGENMIFMLNRTKHTTEDLCVKLLILKILYVLFSTKGISEYFYTNDLCVLVDVFLRELADLDEENESLRHTYLRVLHPLLTKTQLRDIPYKRPQILVALEGMIANSQMREVNPTTKRLVERCLSGDWCVQLRELRAKGGGRVGSPALSDGSAILSPPSHMGPISMAAAQHIEASGSSKVMKNLKYSKSVENLSGRLNPPRQQMPLRSPLDQLQRPSNSSVLSLPGAITTNFSEMNLGNPTPVPITKRRSASSHSPHADNAHHSYRHNSLDASPVSPPLPPYINTTRAPLSPLHLYPRSPVSPVSPDPVNSDASTTSSATARRRPPPPPKRRKAPPVPISHTNSGVTITSIKSSEPSPLSKVHKPQIGVQPMA